ncbi:hypothetical protein [Streptomyces sp. NPDC048349]|uniref:hypothetical protein n=1 Tax=Streptomyces sp. NPDC048349 TaxID=3155486 RepID=UPI0034312CA8
MLLTAAVLTALWWPRSEVVYRSTAPSSVAYGEDGPHHMGVVHEWTPSGRHSYRMVTGRYPAPSYGHWVDLDTTVAREGVETATWTESGLRLRFRTGHEVFVPARFFLGGR